MRSSALLNSSSEIEARGLGIMSTREYPGRRDSKSLPLTIAVELFSSAVVRG